MPDPVLIAEWVGTGFLHGCIIYGAVFGAVVVFNLLRE